MPKKRNTLPQTKPHTPVHPSLSIERDREAPASSISSVNDKLQKLRLQQHHASPHASSHSPQTSLNHPLPPSVQQLLQIPQTPPPRPRPGLTVRGCRRGPAGPPPPGSWLQKHRLTTKCSVPQKLDREGLIAGQLPGLNTPKAGSLQATMYKMLAYTWDFQVHYNRFYLATLPIKMKERLLHYIARHSPSGLKAAGLKLLFLDEDELEEATGAEGLELLDISRSIGTSISLEDLGTFLTPESRPDVILDDTDDWDSLRRSPIPTTAMFITHLSLAQPGISVHWSDLLSLARCLPALTHLSLAHWPRPTLQPNSQTAYFDGPSGQVQGGASNFYSAYDGDFGEDASVIRRLSRSLLCLKWLDLTGCWPWVKCLRDRRIDWRGSWAALETVIVDQGHAPQPLASILNSVGDEADASHVNAISIKPLEVPELKRQLDTYQEVEWELSAMAFELKLRLFTGPKRPVNPSTSSWDNLSDAPQSTSLQKVFRPRATKLQLLHASKDHNRSDFLSALQDRLRRLEAASQQQHRSSPPGN